MTTATQDKPRCPRCKGADVGPYVAWPFIPNPKLRCRTCGFTWMKEPKP